MTLHVQRFVDDDLTIHIGWRFIWKWSRVLAAAREHYIHGLVTIGPWMVAEW
jgi:amino acid permease